MLSIFLIRSLKSMLLFTWLRVTFNRSFVSGLYTDLLSPSVLLNCSCFADSADLPASERICLFLLFQVPSTIPLLYCRLLFFVQLYLGKSLFSIASYGLSSLGSCSRSLAFWDLSLSHDQGSIPIVSCKYCSKTLYGNYSVSITRYVALVFCKLENLTGLSCIDLLAFAHFLKL